MRQLAESRQRLIDMHEARAEGKRRLHCSMARQVSQAIADLERQQQALMQRQDALLLLCQQLLQQRHTPACGHGSNGDSEASRRSSAAHDGEATGVAASTVTATAGKAEHKWSSVGLPGSFQWNLAQPGVSISIEQHVSPNHLVSASLADRQDLRRLHRQQAQAAQDGLTSGSVGASDSRAATAAAAREHQHCAQNPEQRTL